MIDVELIVNKVEHKVVLVIGDTRNVPENLPETFLKEPLVGSLLNLDQVRHIDYFINFTEAHALGIAQLYGFDINHMRIHTPFCFSRHNGVKNSSG